jgi:hypothetical protein
VGVSLSLQPIRGRVGLVLVAFHKNHDSLKILVLADEKRYTEWKVLFILKYRPQH